MKKNLRNFLLFSIFLTGTSGIFAQRTVTGKVIDFDKQPIAGANVVVKGTIIGEVTDADGKYTISVPSSTSIIVFSFIGYVTREIEAGDNSVIDVTLETEATALDEVVVIGYGTQLKRDLTGAVTKVSADKLFTNQAFNLAAAVGGKIAGVKIIPLSGAPGATVMMRVRGTNSINSANSPLFVVDGIVGVANAIEKLNPNDIQSVDVLKDASATAIYGARGSNGVVLITTKRGFSGKTQVEYSGTVSRGVLARHMAALNSEQFMYAFTQGWLNINKYSTKPNWPNCYDASLLPTGYVGATYSDLPHLFEKTTESGYSVPLLGADGNYYKPRFDTNWESLTFTPSTSTDQQISIRGGTNNSKFGVFFGYTLDDGLLINTFMKRYSGRINGDIKITDWLDLSSSLSVNKSRMRQNDDSWFTGGMARGAMEAFPILPVKYPNDVTIYGKYAGQWGNNQDVPLMEVDAQSPVNVANNVETLNNYLQVTGDLTFTIKITPDLYFKTNFAVDGNDYKYNNYASIAISRGNKGSANINISNSFYWQNENYLNYAKIFGNHSITGLLGLSWSTYYYENLNTYNRMFIDDFYGWHNIGAGTYARPAPSSNDGKQSLNSYFGRFNYNYKGKYFFTVTGRIDGSSKFGTNQKYGFFPSASLAWTISEEEFARSIASLSNFKVRISAGQTGNQEIGSYVTQAFIGSTTLPFGDASYTGLYPSSVANPDLRWEKTTQYNGGIDVGFFKDRITLSTDYYYKLTSDMLLVVPLPTSTTTGSVRRNYGKVENKGFEITFGSHNIKSANFNWTTDIAFSSNKNKILQLGLNNADIFGNGWIGGSGTVLRVGEPLGTFFGLTRLGTYGTEEVSLAARYGRKPGDLKFKDKDNDGKINFMNDGDVIGHAFPKWDMNIINNLNYKNFDFNLNLGISFGATKLHRAVATGEDRVLCAGGFQRQLSAWRPDNQNTMVAQLRPSFGNAYFQWFPDTWWAEDASYIRGNGITLGYTFPNTILRSVTRVRVYAGATNFFILTKFTGYDPEGSSTSYGTDNISPNIDFYMYPRPRTYTFGINIIL